MSAATDQIAAAAVIATKRGMRITGYRPKSGIPKHADGSPILEIDMEKPGLQKPEPVESFQNGPIESPTIVKRGVIVEIEQPPLL